jgi:molybdate transport system regulatory protein
MQPKIRVWVCFGERTKFGTGRARLFEVIEELGSINKAVERLGMSYRAAWGYIRELESAAGFQMLRRTPGRSKERSTQLTPQGRRFLERYRTFQHRVEDRVEGAFVHAFKRRAASPLGRKPSRSS